MRRWSGARGVAMGVVAVALGWRVSVDQASKVAHYKGLSPEALMSELTTRYDAKLPTNILGALLTVLIIVVAVDLITALIERSWARLRSAPGAPTPPAGGLDQGP
jgi:hypothetical protein